MQGKLLSDRYLLQDEIGKGGMGSVYRAMDLRTAGTVAIKIPHAALSGDPSFFPRLQREASIAAKIYSPRVVRIIDVNKDQDDTPYLVMEYVPGPTLGDELRARGRLHPHEALALAMEVARALDAADQNNIVHRDLKPHNIKLIDGEVKVLDFGIARAEGEVTANVGTMFMATPEYCAPERLEGLGDIRADIYALGVMLFEMLAGYPPFTGRNPMAVMEKHASLPPPPLPAEVPEPVAAIVACCLEKRPEDRYPTPRVLIDAISEVLGATTTHTGPLVPPPAEPRPLAQTAPIDAGVPATSRLPGAIPPAASPDVPISASVRAQLATAGSTPIAEDVRRAIPPVAPAVFAGQDETIRAPVPPAPRSRSRALGIVLGSAAALLLTGAAGALALRGNDDGAPARTTAFTTTPTAGGAATAAITSVAPATPSASAAATPAPTVTPSPTVPPTPTPRVLPPVVAAEIPLTRARNGEETAVIAAVNAANRFALVAVREVNSTSAEAHFRGQALTDYRGIVVELQRLGRYVIDDMTAIELIEVTILTPTTARLVSREQHTYDEYSIATGAPVDDPSRHYQATLRWTYDLIKTDGRWLIDRQENISEALNPR